MKAKVFPKLCTLLPKPHVSLKDKNGSMAAAIILNFKEALTMKKLP